MKNVFKIEWRRTFATFMAWVVFNTLFIWFETRRTAETGWNGIPKWQIYRILESTIIRMWMMVVVLCMVWWPVRGSGWPVQFRIPCDCVCLCLCFAIEERWKCDVKKKKKRKKKKKLGRPPTHTGGRHISRNMGAIMLNETALALCHITPFSAWNKKHTQLFTKSRNHRMDL